MTGLILSFIIIYFIIKKLEKLNHTDYGSRLINCLSGLNNLLCRKLHRLGDFWIDLPKNGGAIIAANHVSGIDPPVLIAASKRPVRFLCVSTYYDMPVLNYVLKKAGCIPVYRNKDNKLALKKAIEALKKGEVIGIFPFGGIHLPTDKEPRIRSGVAVLSSLAQVDIIPVRIEGVAKFSYDKVFTSLFFPRSNLNLRQYATISPNNYQETEDDKAISDVLDKLYNYLSNHKLPDDNRDENLIDAEQY